MLEKSSAFFRAGDFCVLCAHVLVVDSISGEPPDSLCTPAKDPSAIFLAQVGKILHGKLKRMGIAFAAANGRVVAAPHYAIGTKGLNGHVG